MTDAVEEVFSGWRTKFFSTAGGSHAGPTWGTTSNRSKTITDLRTCPTEACGDRDN